MPEAITFADIQAAADRIRGEAVRTPLLESDNLNALAGRRVLVKAECLQRTGSFKFRGAWNTVSALSAEARAKGALHRVAMKMPVRCRMVGRRIEA